MRGSNNVELYNGIELKLSTYCYRYKLLYMSLMVATKQKPTINTQEEKGLTGRVETLHYGSASLVINVKWDWLTQRCCMALKAKYTLRILLRRNQCGLPKGDLLGYDADAKAWKVMRDKVWALIQATQIIKQPSISPSLGVTENESPFGVRGIQNMVKHCSKSWRTMWDLL